VTASTIRPHRSAAAFPAEGPTLDPFHEAACEAACDADRAYVRAHPGERSYQRQAVEHELCPLVGELGCVDLVGMIEVTFLAPGVRMRELVGYLWPRDQSIEAAIHAAELGFGVFPIRTAAA
jgi:hypothetical protein